MQIAFYCPYCKLKLEIDMQEAGTEAKCPRCSKSFMVPGAQIGPGVTIGGFRILRKIGQGAMGEVYLAHQRSMDREVALKILPYQMTLQEHLVERFLHEVKMTARVEHPNIITAYKAGEDHGVYFLAMRYVEGDSLERELIQKGKLTENEALPIIRSVAEALAFAWDQHQILHRDIKPANIIMDQRRQPMVLDLGLSKSLDGGDVLTLNEMVIGTPNYMSPEQVRGDKEMDTRADMYGLGATLYHMVTGQVPFAGLGLMQTLRNQAMESLPDPREYTPDLSPGMVSLLEHLLAKDVAHRYASWASLMEDIDRVIKGEALDRDELHEGVSVVLRGAPPSYVPASTPPHPAPEASSSHRTRKRTSLRPVWFLPVLSATLCGILLAVSFWMLVEARRYYDATVRLHGKMFGAPPAAAPAAAVPALPEAPEKPLLEDIEAEFEQVVQFLNEHPDRPAEALLRFRKLQKRAEGTPVARMSEDAIRRLQQGR